jgi:hypothetical protein
VLISPIDFSLLFAKVDVGINFVKVPPGLASGDDDTNLVSNYYLNDILY